MNFRDRQGREWTPRLTYLIVRNIKQRTGVSILEIADKTEGLVAAFDRIENFSKVLFASVEREAAKASVTEDDLMDALDGELVEKASEALLDAIVEYFPERKKKLLRKTWEKASEAVEKAEIKILEEAEKALDSLPTETTLNMLESPESNLGDTVSGNSSG